MGSTGYGEFGKGPAQSRVKAINALTDPGVRNTLLIGSRLQEHTFRVQSADAVMRAQLIEKGFDPEQHYPTKQEIVDKVGIDEFETMVGASVSASLNETFAASSIPGTAPDVLLDLFSRHPVFAPLLQAGLPFPRFAFVNAPRWIWQHNPFAPLIEGPTLGITNRFRGDILPALRGQRYFGQKRQSLEQTTIPGLDAEIGRATLQNAIALQNVFQARRDALDAATRFNAAIKAAEKSGTLPLDAHDEIAEASRQMTEAVARQTDQTAAYKALAQRVRNLGKQRKEARGQLQQLQEAGAPATAAEYYARLTTGAALLGAAYMLRSAPGQAKTKWNEWRYRQPDLPGLPGSGHTADVDLTPYSPIVQFLLPMDIAHDVWTHTDWKAARTAFQDGGSNYDSLVDAMHTYYTGKYTQSEIWKEAAQSYLTYSPAAGTSRDLLDLITGRTSGSSDIAETIPDAVLATIGQWIGGFTTPLQQINEIEGQFRPEAAKARIPAMGTEEQSQRFQELLGPTLANIPHVREHLVPEKISPLTGKAVQTIDPLARFGAGLTQRERSRFEEEINVTGFPYGQLVPRQMGDRAFDNVVAKHYYQMLKEYLEPELLDDPEYQELTPELKRDRINGMLNGLKKAAYYEAGEEMGLDDEATFQKVEPKGTREKRERWIRWMDQLNKEADRDHPQAPEPQQQEPGGPPPGLGGGAAGGPPPPL
jgi:hypothetical protein